jgi:hypothetical protein
MVQTSIKVSKPPSLTTLYIVSVMEIYMRSNDIHNKDEDRRHTAGGIERGVGLGGRRD